MKPFKVGDYGVFVSCQFTDDYPEYLGDMVLIADSDDDQYEFVVKSCGNNEDTYANSEELRHLTPLEEVLE